ncbi:MAG: anti-sigma factor family protein [Candidatus Zixiibacteriota bacterium]
MNDDIRKLLSGFIDGELDDDQRMMVERELEQNSDLRRELEELQRLKETTDMMRYADLPDEVWDDYWSSIYRKTERGMGWIAFSVGAIILLGFGLFEGLSAMYADPTAPWWLKAGITGVGAGLVFLLVSYGRERLFVFKRDRYREVQK